MEMQLGRTGSDRMKIHLPAAGPEIPPGFRLCVNESASDNEDYVELAALEHPLCD